MAKKRSYWVKLPYLELSVHVMGMSIEEKGQFLDKLIQDLHKDESNDQFISTLINERQDYREIQSKNGKKSAKIKKDNKLEKVTTVEPPLNHGTTTVEPPLSDGVTTHQPETKTETKTETKQEIKKKDIVPSVEETECMELVDFWNNLSDVPKVQFPSEVSRKKLITTYRSRKKEQGKEMLDMLLKEIPKLTGARKSSWFNLRNLLGSADKVQKIRDGAYVWLNEDKPSNGSSVSLTAFMEVD